MIRKLLRADTLANISIIGVALLVGGILVKQYLLKSKTPPLQSVKVGQAIGIDNANWGHATGT